jgi:hypothetical protein
MVCTVYPGGPMDYSRPGTGGASQPLDERCAALIAQLRELCPGVLPEAALPPGQPGQPIPVPPEQYGQLAAVAARQAAALATLGRLPLRDDDLPGAIVWEDGGAVLAVILAELELAVTEGGITVVLPVWCDQLPDRQDKVAVTFAVGAPDRPVGLLAATTGQPLGPAVVVDAWGEQLTALAWRAVLDTAAGIAGNAGTDSDGTPLVATALAAAKDRLEVLPQARHPFDRVPTGRAVLP